MTPAEWRDMIASGELWNMDKDEALRLWDGLDGDDPVTTDCKRCGREFVTMDGVEYCSRDCELGYVGYPNQKREEPHGKVISGKRTRIARGQSG